MLRGIENYSSATQSVVQVFKGPWTTVSQTTFLCFNSKAWKRLPNKLSMVEKGIKQIQKYLVKLSYSAQKLLLLQLLLRSSLIHTCCFLFWSSILCKKKVVAKQKFVQFFFHYRPLMGGLLLMMAILPSSIAFYRVQQRRDLEWRRRLWSATARWRSRMFQEKYLMPPVAIELTYLVFSFFHSSYGTYSYYLYLQF